MSTWCEGIVKELEVGPLEKSFCRTYRIRGVGNDNVVGALVISEESKAITNVDRNTRIGKESRHMGKIFFGYANNSL